MSTKGIAYLMLATLTVGAGQLRLRAQSASLQTEIKAAYLYHFAQFVKWPANAFSGPRSPFSFCVLEDAQFSEALQRTIDGEQIDGRQLELRRLSRSASLNPCHLIFVPPSSDASVKTILSRVNDWTLTVGDDPGFLRAGGMMNFVVDGNRVRFEINPRATERSRLQISSKLRRLARVSPDGRTERSQ